MDAKSQAPGSRLLLRRGPVLDALPPDLTVDHCHTRFECLVLGSGDGSFAPLVQEFRVSGLRVEIVALGGAVSAALTAAAAALTPSPFASAAS